MEKQYEQNPVLKNILRRKSVRSYADRPVEEGKIQALLEAAMAAPSGKNARPWELIVITRRETLDQMAERLPYAKMLREAPSAIVIGADTAKSDYWFVDCAAAAQNLLLAAEALELGAVWTATYPYPERMAVVRDCCKLPQGYDSLCVIPIGYPAREQSPRDKYEAKKIHREQF